ncbi:MAG: Fur family transcriptional regulator [Actinomycetota bacterium]
MNERPPRKATRQRAAIVAALDSAHRFKSAQELHDSLRRSGSTVGLATVYRNLQALARNGELDVLVSSDGEALYRRCDTDDHHHHLVCRVCHKTVEIEADEIEAWVTRTGASHGYAAVTHTVELFGVCRECRTRVG